MSVGTGTTLRDSWGSGSGPPLGPPEKKTENGCLNTKVVENPGEEKEEDENVFPGPLPLSILIIGIALSVFLISLDRTIITTVS